MSRTVTIPDNIYKTIENQTKQCGLSVEQYIVNVVTSSFVDNNTTELKTEVKKALKQSREDEKNGVLNSYKNFDDLISKLEV